MITIKTKIKAIIFDMDGTIIKTEHIWRDISVRVLMEQCKLTQLEEHHEAYLDSLSGIGFEASCEKMKRTFNLATPVEEIIKRKLELSESLFNQKIDFIEGFEEFHKELQAHAIPTSIATNAQASDLKKHAQAMNFTQFFGPNMYCIADVGFKPKPDPALFLHAADKLGAKPEECLVFEDSLYGFQAANAAGMKCIAIKNNTNKPHRALAHHAIDDYSQAREAIKKIILP